MERLTLERCGELLIKYADGEYRSPCFGCESIGKCNPQKIPCGFYGALERLKYYEDLQEQGRIQELPCAVGDLVHEVYRFLDAGAWEIDVHKIRLEDLDKIGKTVFITREEAEEALKRMEDGE